MLDIKLTIRDWKRWYCPAKDGFSLLL